MFLPFIRIFSLMLLLAIISTHSFGAQKDNFIQYPDEAKSTRTAVFVRVVFMEPEEVNKFCNDGVVSDEYVILGCYDPRNNTIYAPEPRNFNDLERLEILGHEFWHALGADHP